MKIQNVESNYSRREIGQELFINGQPQKLKKVGLKDSVNVTISKEGKEKFKKDASLNQAIERSNNDKLEKSMGEVKDSIDYALMLSGKINVLAKEKKNGLQDGQDLTVKDTAECIMNSYAQLYDEIVRGYKDGSREVFVTDKKSENGHRKLTQEEELEGLADAYKEVTSDYEQQVHRDRRTNEALKSNAEKVVAAERMRVAGRMRVDTVQKALEEIKEIDHKMAEVIPENMSEKLLKAANSFSIQYNGMKNSNILTEILSGIEIW